MKPASWAEKVTAQQDGSENRSKFTSRIFKDTRWTEMRGHIPCHISTTHFSPQQRHLAEKIGTGSHFDKGNRCCNRCCRNVNNKIEKVWSRSIILIMSDNQPISLFKKHSLVMKCSRSSNQTTSFVCYHRRLVDVMTRCDGWTWWRKATGRCAAAGLDVTASWTGTRAMEDLSNTRHLDAKPPAPRRRRSPARTSLQRT